MQQNLRIDGIDVIVEGEGERTLVMVHGWPDTYRVWDAQVASFKAHYRCVRFTLPGFDSSQPRRAVGLDEMVGTIAHIVNAVSPNDPVTLLLHDWGALFGYQFCMRFPERVDRVIGVDIGDTASPQYVTSLDWKAKLGVAGYQLFLALAWKVGGRLGTGMTRAMAKLLKAPAPPEVISADMNFPYYIFWTGAHGSYRGMRPLEPHCPVLFIYGRRKPFMFHSPQWVQRLNDKPGSQALSFDTDHWPMVRQPQAFNEAVLQWLAKS